MSDSPDGARRWRSQAPEITAGVKETWQHRREDHSAGGVAYRPCGETYEVALIATRGGTRWQLPKGTCEAGETAEATAIREVEEEVGLKTENREYLRAIEYWYWDTFNRSVPELVHKRVDFFLLRVTGGELSDDCLEVDASSWFTLEQAEDILTFQGEIEVLRAAIACLK
jgi:8-oxo-dGTP pyrophosphatase MutT (NUDIX family)